MGAGTGWNRFGPAKLIGDARSPHTGSVSTRTPSISTSTVECPSHVARSPVSTGRAQVSSGLTTGSGLEGARRCPPNRYSLKVGSTVPFLRPGTAACVLRKVVPSNRGEDLMRSRRSPSTRPPKADIGRR